MPAAVLTTSMIYAEGRPFPKGSYRKNRSKIERLIKDEPKIEYFFEFARLEAVQHHWDKAQAILEKILERDPDNLEGMLFLAQVMENKEMFEQADELYQKSLQMAPNDSLVYREYGRFFMNRNELKSAQTHLFKALELNSADAYAHSLLAELYLLLGYQAQALFHLELASYKKESHPFYYPQSARILMKMGFYEKAAQLWKKAMQWDPKNDIYRSQFRLALKAKQKGADPNKEQVVKNWVENMEETPF